MPVDIDISITYGRWDDVLPRAELVMRRVCDAVFFHKALSPVASQLMELSVVLADDSVIRQLNATYRHQDKPTNVLSFPSQEIIPGAPWQADGTGEAMALGDVIFALETIEREAREQGKSLRDHFCHLLVHGILHLLGYDHIMDKEAEVMEALEVAILQTIGINNPYEDEQAVSAVKSCL